MPPLVAAAPVVLVAAALAVPPEVSARPAPSSREAAVPAARAMTLFGRRLRTGSWAGARESDTRERSMGA